MILLFNIFISNDICLLINFFIYTGSKKIKLIFFINRYTFYFYHSFLVNIENLLILLSPCHKSLRKKYKIHLDSNPGPQVCHASTLSTVKWATAMYHSPPLVQNSSPDSTNIERYMLLKLSKLQWVLLVPLDLNVSYLEKKLWLNQDFCFVNPCL